MKCGVGLGLHLHLHLHNGMYEYAINTVAPIFRAIGMGHEMRHYVFTKNEQKERKFMRQMKGHSQLTSLKNKNTISFCTSYILPSNIHGLSQCQTLAVRTHTSLTRRIRPSPRLLSGPSSVCLSRLVLSIPV